MSSGPGPLLRALAWLLLRGPGASFVRGDLDEAMGRDLERGVPLGRARLRYLANALASAVALARDRLRAAGPLRNGPSWLDVKLGWRMLAKTPVLTAVSVFSLAVGIPVGMAPIHVMGAFDAPPPVDAGDRLMGLRYRGGRGGVPTTSWELDTWANALASFETLGAVRRIELNVEPEGGVAAPVAAAEATGSAFAALRTPPLLGRPLLAADDAPGAQAVAVLGHGLWRSRFHGDLDVIGATVGVAGVPHTVVGVMPDGFRFPMAEDLWVPLRDEVAVTPGVGRPLQILGRLRDGVGPDRAHAELGALHETLAADLPALGDGLRAEVVSLTTMLWGAPRGGVRATPGIGPFSVLVVFQAMTLTLLLVACLNVGLLIFARTASRSAELSVRTALGASRGRLVIQVVTEALVLAVVAAGAGILGVELLAGAALVEVWPPGWGAMPWWIDVGVTPPTVVRALALAALCAVAAAAVPALRVTGPDVRATLGRSDGGFGVRIGRVWGALIVTDVAVAVAVVGLTVGIGTRMGQVASAPEIADIPVEEYLAVRVDLPAASPDSDQEDAGRLRLATVQRDLLDRLRAEPGVRAVAAAERLPRMDHSARRLEVEGGVSEPVEVVRVHPDFFSGFGRSVRAGRGFDARDLEGDRAGVIVNTSFSTELLAGANPLGRRVRYLSGLDREPGPWMEVVGVVDDLGTDLMREGGSGTVYHSAAPGEIRSLRLAVHAGAEPTAFLPRLRAIATEVDPDLLVVPLGRLADVYPEDWYLLIAMLVGWGLFVGILLALGASGMYGVMAFAVAQRTREIGIRAALGAGTADIVGTIGRRAAVQLALGALIGMPVAGWIYRLTQSGDAPTVEAFVAGLLPGLGVIVLVGVTACAVPLQRALAVEPHEAIRGGG